MNTCTACGTTQALKWKGMVKPPLLCNACYRKRHAAKQRTRKRAKYFDMWGGD